MVRAWASTAEDLLLLMPLRVHCTYYLTCAHTSQHTVISAVDTEQRLRSKRFAQKSCSGHGWTQGPSPASSRKREWCGTAGWREGWIRSLVTDQMTFQILTQCLVRLLGIYSSWYVLSQDEYSALNTDHAHEHQETCYSHTAHSLTAHERLPTLECMPVRVYLYKL